MRLIIRRNIRPALMRIPHQNSIPRRSTLRSKRPHIRPVRIFFFHNQRRLARRQLRFNPPHNSAPVQSKTSHTRQTMRRNIILRNRMHKIREVIPMQLNIIIQPFSEPLRHLLPVPIQVLKSLLSPRMNSILLVPEIRINIRLRRTQIPRALPLRNNNQLHNCRHMVLSLRISKPKPQSTLILSQDMRHPIRSPANLNLLHQPMLSTGNPRHTQTQYQRRNPQTSYIHLHSSHLNRSNQK